MLILNYLYDSYGRIVGIQKHPQRILVRFICTMSTESWTVVAHLARKQMALGASTNVIDSESNALYEILVILSVITYLF